MKYTYADMHCDTLMRAWSENSDSIYNGKGMQSLEKQSINDQLLQFYAIFFPPVGAANLPDDDTYYHLLRNALLEKTREYSDRIGMAYSYEDVMKNHAQGKVSAMLTIEDGRFVNGSLTKIKQLYDDGVRAIALTWNYENCFGFPNSKDPTVMNRGLKAFGIEAIQYMQDLGILVDVSHLSDGGFWDVAKHAKLPFIASHSSCRALTNHPRNLTDEMLRQLADHGGIAGVNFCPDFITLDPKEPEETAVYIAKHIEHMIKIGGEDLPAIGTDFDGIQGKLEIDEPAKMDLLFTQLEADGIPSHIIEKVAFRNVLRVLKDAVK